MTAESHTVATPDPVIRRVLHEEAVRLANLTQSVAQLAAPWQILHAAVLPLPPLPASLSEAQAQVVAGLGEEGVPHRMIFECWDALREELEPPSPPAPELERLSRRLDSLLGVRPAPGPLRG